MNDERTRRNRSIFWIILACIAGLIIGGLIGYYWARNQIDPAQSLRDERDRLERRINELEERVNQEQRNARELINWEYYTNNQYNFRIGYPSDWDLTTNTNEGIAVITNFQYPAQDGTELREGQTKRVLTVEANSQNLSPRDFQNRQSNDEIRNVSTIQADGLEATKIELSSIFGRYYRIYFPDSEQRRFIIMTSLGSEDNLDQMIRTFNFTR